MTKIVCIQCGCRQWSAWRFDLQADTARRKCKYCGRVDAISGIDLNDLRWVYDAQRAREAEISGVEVSQR